jgi:hypothetical protein
MTAFTRWVITQKLDGMTQNRDNDPQVFDCTLGAAGQIDNERMSANTRCSTRKHGVLRNEIGRAHV